MNLKEKNSSSSNSDRQNNKLGALPLPLVLVVPLMQRDEIVTRSHKNNLL